MYVARLALQNFRSWDELDLQLDSGPVSLIGANGRGKTNVLEAIDYIATLSSHRVGQDAPLVRSGSQQAIARAEAVRDGRSALLEVEINPGQSNRARVNGSYLPRAREVSGLLRTVVFAPEDVTLIKGDPAQRRGFVDAVAVMRAPRIAGERADYDRVLRQRNALLKSAGKNRNAEVATLDVWDEQLARSGGAIMAARVELLNDLAPHLEKAHMTVASSAEDDRRFMRAGYLPSVDISGVAGGPGVDGGPERVNEAAITDALRAELQRRRPEELERGVSLVGPHRDDVAITLGDLPAKGYASHGESWTLALGLKLGSFDLLRSEGDDPILMLDDVFAELDRDRRSALATAVADTEQVLVTAAVDDDVPGELAGARYRIDATGVHRD